MTRTSREAIEVLIRRAGLSPAPGQIDEIHDGWARLEPMLERIRGEGRSHAVAPAHIFRADAVDCQADDPETR